MMKTISRIRTFAVVATLVVGCAVSEPQGVDRNGDEIRGTGTVLWHNLEGGFFAIRGDDGETYDPINLPADFQIDGLKVWFAATIRGDLGGFHMVGPLVELKQIRRQ